MTKCEILIWHLPKKAMLFFDGQGHLVTLMVMVEGKEMRGKRIHKNVLAKFWRRLSSNPLPKINAFRLEDEDFNNIIDQRRCYEDNLREIEEWGRVLSTKGTDACVFNACENEGADYVILVRRNPFHRLDEIILHELSHIARGDL